MTLQLLDDKILLDSDAIALDADCCCCIENCDECCTGFSVPTEIIVDLGAPNLTPGVVCNFGAGTAFDCTDITGEFTLTDNSNCEFTFLFDEVAAFCGVTGIPGFTGNIEFLLTRIFESGTCHTCYWKLLLTLSGSGPAVAGYETVRSAFTENDCTLATPVSLTKTFDNWGSLCSGTMPSTITIEAAP